VVVRLAVAFGRQTEFASRSTNETTSGRTKSRRLVHRTR
jgi:hypothetical protein